MRKSRKREYAAHMRFLKLLIGLKSGERRPNKKIWYSLQTENIRIVKKYQLNWKQRETAQDSSY